MKGEEKKEREWINNFKWKQERRNERKKKKKNERKKWKEIYGQNHTYLVKRANAQLTFLCSFLSSYQAVC